MQAFLDTAPDWILNGPEWLNEFCYSFFKSFIHDSRWMQYVEGLGNTLLLTALALVLGLIIGIVISIIRVSWDNMHAELRPGVGKFVLRIANAISKIYLTVIRGTPVVVQIMIIFFVIMASSNNKILAGVIAFGMNSGAYVAEIIRSGIMSIDKGQMEAGRSLGFGYVATMRHIILPQAFKNVLPALVNEFIVLLKETAIAGYVGLTDLTRAANIVRGVAYVDFLPLLGVAVVYLILVLFFTWLMGKLERRLRVGNISKQMRSGNKKKEVAA
ncbi:MAG: amino acid ABC transporter permease [Oscillospiraceae bacterium]|nr:amino acid ABC transporter permease [Oscillospiraceae bacterium]